MSHTTGEAGAMALLHIHLLGGCRLTYDGQPLNTLNQARVQSLLAWLLLHRHAPQPRGHLAFTFWPDVNEAHARNNLRQMLHQLRHALPADADYVRADANSVQWSPDAPWRLDVADFETAAANAAKAARSEDKEMAAHALQAAFDLYGGDLLPGCYDDWIGPERERLRQAAHAAGRQLLQLHEEQRNYRVAIEVGRRLLQLDTLDEATYAALMRLHALNNDRAGALRIYHDCVTILQRELEVEPGDAVQAAYQRLLHLRSQPIPAGQPSPLAGAIPLIGRRAEWEQVQAAWQASARGQPVLLLITGEAGIGKTRLAEELYEWAARQGIACARTRAYAAEGRLAYAPVTEWLRSRALAPALARLDGLWRSEVARLLPELLHQQPALASPAPMDEQWQRQHFFTGLARATLAVDAPILLLLDDMQWCDQETLEWLHFLLRFDAQARLLVLGTVRDGELAANAALVSLMRALQRASQLHEVALGPLDAPEVVDLAGRISKRPLAVAETLHLLHEAEGVPLFVVEMVRAGLKPQNGQPELWHADAAPSRLRTQGSSALPPKVHAVIAGRLDQLSAGARDLLGVAATIGRAFTFNVLRSAASKDEETVIDALEELWQRRIVREQGADGYDFSHDKLRDVAYSEISPMQRRRLHRRVAVALLELHAADPGAVSGQVAAHYEQAGQAEEAIHWYGRAADVAKRLLAHEEAIGHLRRGLALLATLPPTAEHERQALALLLPLGTLLAAVKGNAAAAVREVYTQALDRCRREGDAGQTFVVQQELRICYGQRGELAIARPLAQENLALAATLENPELRRYAHLGVAVIYHAQGELASALTHFEQAIGQAAAPSGSFDPLFFDNALQGSLRHSALTLWLLGHPDQAQARMAEALAQGRQQAQSIRYAMTLMFAAMLHHYCGETAGVAQRAQEIEALAGAHSYTYLQVSGSLFAGWALAHAGQFGPGIAQMQAALAVRQASSHRLFLPYELGLLAEAHLLAGQAAAGLNAIAAALAVTAATGEYVWQAELLRLRAELLLAQGAAVEEVAACYWEAIGLARRQAARALELRAATGLARLWVQTGKQAEAHALLAPIYAPFMEGMDTPDMAAARALLAPSEPRP